MSIGTDPHEIEMNHREGSFVERHGPAAAISTLGLIAGTGAGILLSEVASEQTEALIPTIAVTAGAMAAAGALWMRAFKKDYALENWHS